MKQISMVVGVAFLSILGSASVAAADTTSSPPVICTNCPQGTGSVDPDGVSAEAHDFQPGTGGPGGVKIPTSSSYLAGCHFTFVPAGEEITLHPTAGAWIMTWTEDHWVVWCPPQVIAYTFYPVGDPPPAVVIDDMIADAYARTPVVAFNPRSSPDGDDAIPLVTQMLTFLWVDDAHWVPVSATASIPGFSVTTTATPVESTWVGGQDPPAVTCDQGTPYVFGIGGDDAQDQRCTTVFERSSAVADHRLELTVRWDVAYTCSIPVCGGSLPPLFTTSIRPVTVAEIQAIETASP